MVGRAASRQWLFCGPSRVPLLLVRRRGCVNTGVGAPPLWQTRTGPAPSQHQPTSSGWVSACGWGNQTDRPGVAGGCTGALEGFAHAIEARTPSRVVAPTAWFAGAASARVRKRHGADARRAGQGRWFQVPDLQYFVPDTPACNPPCDTPTLLPVVPAVLRSRHASVQHQTLSPVAGANLHPVPCRRAVSATRGR